MPVTIATKMPTPQSAAFKRFSPEEIYGSNVAVKLGKCSGKSEPNGRRAVSRRKRNGESLWFDFLFSYFSVE
jgi:hypothetical protein